MITSLLPYLQTFLAIGNVAIMLYALKTFLGKPHDMLEEKHDALEKRVDEHDVKLKEVSDSLKLGNDRFREQVKTNATFKSVMLSFVNFEIAYCIHNGYDHTEDLMKAKQELEDYLSGK